MTLHRLSAGAGYAYLLRNTSCGDVHRETDVSLTAYYTATGYPPGRWVGAGLSGLADGAGIPAGQTVTEPAMAAMFGEGRDPVTDAALGRAYPKYRSAADRIAARAQQLRADTPTQQRNTAVAAITEEEQARPVPVAVAGFDLTFTVPKSASVLWALGEPAVQDLIVAAHRDAVTQTLQLLQDRALFTRTGTNSCQQVTTRGAVAAGFEHWDTRTGDPNLHTHLVVANKVQGPDGAWRSVDSRALYRAAVAASEIYDNLFADQLAVRLPVSWQWRDRGARRNPAYELDGLHDDLLTAFSTRSQAIAAAADQAFRDFAATHSRAPGRTDVIRIRQQATLATRPAKTPRSLADLIPHWRARAERLLGHDPAHAVHQVLDGLPARPLRCDEIPDTVIHQLTAVTRELLIERRSTWTRWNVLAETARTTRSLRMTTPLERHALHDRVADAVQDNSLKLDPPELFHVPAEYRRSDGASVFSRAHETRYTDRRILDAECHLLLAHNDITAPTIDPATAARSAEQPLPTADRPPGSPERPGIQLAGDQVDAVLTIAASGRRLDVLVGPPGTGKTTALRALRRTWETGHGHGSVIGLAPSATAASELADALDLPCENTAKWIYETQTRPQQPADHFAGHQTAAGPDRPSPWQLRPGQLVIVDEASLAGTLVLDTIARQATHADAKILLVGDHAQLSGVEAGGAFRFLANRGTPIQLSTLFRFRHPWEAAATRGLRAGEHSCLDAYAEHDRLHDGPWETMIDAAYTSYRDTETAGHSAVLLAADNATVESLNARAHTDRVTAGHVNTHGITTRDGTPIGIGERIVTRRNDRRLRPARDTATAPGADWVRNGALWDVQAVHLDGSLTVTPATRHAPAAPQPAEHAPVVLPADYVHEHIEHGYATTIYRAEGITVDAGYVLATPTLTREALTVAMTRGRHSNHLYLATDLPDYAHDHLGDPGGAASASTPRQILETILDHTGAELSATETRQQLHEQASSPQTLLPIAATLAADATARRWSPQLQRCGLTRHQVDAIDASPSRGALHAALRAGERAGYPMPNVLRQLVTARPLDDTTPGNHEHDPARDVAAVLHQRVTTWLLSEDIDHRSAPDEPFHRIDVGAAETHDLAYGPLCQIEEILMQKRTAAASHINDPIESPGI